MEPSDIKAVLAQVFGDDYKWILYGDDDTMWFIEGVLNFLEVFDPEMPYFITGQLIISSHFSL